MVSDEGSMRGCLHMLNADQLHRSIVRQDDDLRQRCLTIDSEVTPFEVVMLDCQLAIHERLGNLMELLARGNA